MRTPKLLVIILLFFAHASWSQKGDLMVKRSDNGLYLEHKVQPKESFFSIGRTYNLHPKTIAGYNKLDLTKSLQIDQKLRIPLIDTNFIQQGNSGTPVYYKVGDNEGLMTISNKHQNVSLAMLRFWNKLTADKLKEDSKLIIGFLQSKSLPVITISGQPQTEEPTVKSEEKPQPVVQKPVPEEEKPAKKEENKNPSPTTVTIEEKPAVNDFSYFRPHFEKQTNSSPNAANQAVTSGIFKTLSGWQDGKYYLLIDNVSPGTIVKIINPTNNRVIYAKVLGKMSGIRQNEGLEIRISNAAAAALEVSEPDKFILKLTY